jgi:hypothetical protein
LTELDGVVAEPSTSMEKLSMALRQRPGVSSHREAIELKVLASAELAVLVASRITSNPTWPATPARRCELCSALEES